MALSKKHYKAIAEVLKKIMERDQGAREQIIGELADEFSNYFIEDNPARFNPETFHLAICSTWG